MDNQTCSNCGQPAKRLCRDLCRKCYKAWCYQRSKEFPEKVCPKCHTPRRRFIKGICDKCYLHEYYQKNRPHLIEKATKWIKNNIEKYRSYARKTAKKRWASLSTEEKTRIVREQEKRRGKDERERRKAYAKKYYQDNKNTEHSREQYRAAKEARRARENNVPNLLTRREWRKIKEAYGYCCAYCGTKAEKLTQDHVKPISKGGWHVAQNIVPACQPCNRKKGVGPPPNGFVMKKIVFD